MPVFQQVQIYVTLQIVQEAGVPIYQTYPSGDPTDVVQVILRDPELEPEKR